jgi:dienelactone hydrolase
MRILSLLVLAGLFLTQESAALAQHALRGFGVVLLHGKAGSPGGMMGGLADDLRGDGALVETPEMPWSARRIYDATYDAAFKEIDAAVADLRKKGAIRIVVGGHSMGGNAAIAYGARRDGLAGVFALAPGHTPDSGLLRLHAHGAVAKARQLIAAGQGTVRMSFPDMAQGIPFSVTATPVVYLSFFDPDGPASMPRNVAALSMPLLWVVGLGDPMVVNGRDYAFARTTHPKSKYVVIPALHLTTPMQSRQTVVDWLKLL